MLKFNNLVNKIIVECSDSNIISEDVTVNDIRDMINQIDKREAERIREYFVDGIERLFYKAESRLRENKLNDTEKIIVNDIEKNIVNKDEFTEKFISSLSDKELTSKPVISKLADVILDEIKDTDITKDDIVKLIKKNLNIDLQNYHKTKEIDYQRILHDIDASRITDDDIKVYTPETFKSYNKKAKGAFSYAIFLKENLPIAIAHFDSDGNKDYVLSISHSVPSGYLTKAIEKSDKIIAISNEYRNNIKYRPYYHEVSDDYMRRVNKERREYILRQRRYERYIKQDYESVKNDIETLLNSIKEDLSHYKEKLMNIDMFDDDIAKAFIEFKHDYNDLKEEFNEYLKRNSAYDGIKIRTKNLKLKYLRLIELLKKDHESVKNDIETLLNSIKEDLSPYKEKLMNIDVFDNDIAKAFIELKHDYNLVKEELNNYLKKDDTDDDGIRNIAKDLKSKYLRLIELLEKEN